MSSAKKYEGIRVVFIVKGCEVQHVMVWVVTWLEKGWQKVAKEDINVLDLLGALGLAKFVGLGLDGV